MPSLLWNSFTLGDIHLDHRLAMAPMTRGRATSKGVPTPINATYYAQRASMALIISEGTQPSADGQGYPLTPGIYSPEQIAGWRLITDAVHNAGGRIIIQLMHVGRISHPLNTLHGRQPVAPSGVKAAGTIFTSVGALSFPQPRALSLGGRGRHYRWRRWRRDSRRERLSRSPVPLEQCQPAHRRVRGNYREPHSIRGRGRLGSRR